MVQTRTYLYIPAPISSYESFGNLDFGTVKGFSFQYDMRRTGNLRLTTNYTLQFANGTGSSTTSQRGLTSRGNIRNLLPLSRDERHRVVATIDYRYGSGKRYSGPRWFGSDVFLWHRLTTSDRFPRHHPKYRTFDERLRSECNHLERHKQTSKM